MALGFFLILILVQHLAPCKAFPRPSSHFIHWDTNSSQHICVLAFLWGADKPKMLRHQLFSGLISLPANFYWVSLYTRWYAGCFQRTTEQWSWAPWNAYSLRGRHRYEHAPVTLQTLTVCKESAGDSENPCQETCLNQKQGMDREEVLEDVSELISEGWRVCALQVETPGVLR